MGKQINLYCSECKKLLVALFGVDDKVAAEPWYCTGCEKVVECEKREVG